jgi:putative transposase
MRFGIESSYRQRPQARIRTCTRSPLWRRLYVAVALLLRNVWGWLQREILARGRRGGRIDLNQLVFRQMLVWLQHVVEEQLGSGDSVATERPLRT